MATENEWDKERVYDEKIHPLMAQIIAICEEHAIPIAATFQFSSEGHRCTTSLGYDRASDDMKRVINAVQPRRAPALAITKTTGPEGTRISVRSL